MTMIMYCSALHCVALANIVIIDHPGLVDDVNVSTSLSSTKPDSVHISLTM